jgi:LysR family transcriptional regulator, cyn operon transcriptional activator
MELRGVRYFVAVANARSFSRAAEELRISQSALSRQVQLLEAEFGVSLFDRIGRGVALTRAGEDLLARSQSVLQDVQALKDRAHELAGGSKGLLRIGTTPQTLESLVGRLLTEYRRSAPDVTITLVEGGSANLISQVEAGAIDMAFAALPSDATIAGRVLFPLGALAVVPRHHPLAKRQQLEVADLKDLPLRVLRPGFMTRQLLDGACAIANVQPVIVLESGNPHCLLALAEQGHGIAIIPSTVNLKGVKQRVLPIQRDGKQLGLWIWAIWDRRRHLSPAVTNFIDHAYLYTRHSYPGREFGFHKLLGGGPGPDAARSASRSNRG